MRASKKIEKKQGWPWFREKGNKYLLHATSQQSQKLHVIAAVAAIACCTH
jgi:hypothetical protein